MSHHFGIVQADQEDQFAQASLQRGCVTLGTPKRAWHLNDDSMDEVLSQNEDRLGKPVFQVVRPILPVSGVSASHACFVTDRLASVERSEERQSGSCDARIDKEHVLSG